jgi:hypothetical protein
LHTIFEEVALATPNELGSPWRVERFVMIAESAYIFALKYGSLNIIRKFACKDPYFAYRYAMDIDKCPRKDTRNAACKSPEWAYEYALHIDKKPRNDTRKNACKSPECAYLYASNIDQCPRNDTREAACKNSCFAYLYAKDIDAKPTKETWLSVKNTEHEEDYKKILKELIKEQII